MTNAAFGGEGVPVPTGGKAAVWRRKKAVPTAGGKLPVPTGRGKRGQDTKYGFLSPLDSPHLPLR